VTLDVQTGYPWDEDVRIRVRPEAPASFTLALRVPGWCRRPALRINGRATKLAPLLSGGYARIRRRWEPGDAVELRLPMPVERIEAHPSVRSDAGRVALQRGPLVYCLEEADNGADLNDQALPRGASLTARHNPRLLGGVVTIHGKGKRRRRADWAGRLYSPDAGRLETVAVMAVPYFAWCNRRPGEMLVWLRE
jgi:hypothetical protein